MNIQGLKIELTKVASFKYFKLTHLDSGFAITSNIQYKCKNKELFALIEKHTSGLDWSLHCDIISNDRKYYDSVCGLVKDVRK